MLRVALVAAVLSVLALPAAAAAENTPDGPATIANGGLFACPADFSPEVLMGWRVVVAEGGQAGYVRPQFRFNRTTTLGDRVELPAAPGTYTFPAPRVAWDCGGSVDIVQETGGHAIVTRQPCPPDREYPCETWLTVSRDGQEDERIDGAQIATGAIVEPDWDQDLRGDVTEDRTDLRVSATPSRDPDGRLRIAVTLNNAGPLPADRVVMTPSGMPAAWRWEGCPQPGTDCSNDPLAAGASRTLHVVSDHPDAFPVSFEVRAEGPDLAAADNRVEVTAPAAPAFDIVAAERQRLSRGITAQVRGVRAGRASVTVKFRVRGRTIRIAREVWLEPYTARTLTLRAQGAKLRSLRRAVRRGPVRAEISVRAIGGKTPIAAPIRVR